MFVIKLIEGIHPIFHSTDVLQIERKSITIDMTEENLDFTSLLMWRSFTRTS